ncbi:MAG: glycosyltransferase family 39 protein [Candidatus Aminicenantales bacterium]
MAKTELSGSSSQPLSGNRSQPRWKFFVGLILLGHLAITVFLSYKLNIWIDEAYTLNTTGQSLGYALEKSLQFESQAPLYFLLLNAWRKIDGSIFFGRLCSVICAVLTLLSYVQVSRYYLPGMQPVYLPAATALNPYLIWAAVEMRLYSLAILLTSLLMLFFYRRFIVRRKNRFDAVLLAVFSGIAVLTSYYFLLLLTAFLGYILVRRSRRDLFEYLVMIFPSLILVIPLLAQVPRQMASHFPSQPEQIGLLRSFRIVFGLIQNLVLHLTALPLSAHVVIPALFFFITVCLVLRFKRKIAGAQIVIWTLFGITSAGFVFLVVFFGPNVVSPRYLFVIFILSSLAYFSVGFFLPESARNKFAAYSLLVMVPFHAFILISRYSPLAKSGDYLRASSALERMEKPGEPIIVFNPEAAMSLSVYYRGRNDVVPIPRKIDFERYDIRDFVIRDEEQIVKAMGEALSRRQNIWFFHAGLDKYQGVDYQFPLLEKFLSREFEVESAFVFFRSELRYLRRKASSD